MMPYSEYINTDVCWASNVPSHWERNRFKFVFEEKSATQNLTLQCGAISFGVVKYKDSEKLTDETKAAYQEVLSGEFLINPLNMNFDLKSLRTALSDINVIVSSGYIVLKSQESSSKNFLKWLLHVFDVRHMKTLGSGVRQTITFKDIGNCWTYLPPLDEQKLIASFLDKEVGRIDGLIKEKENFIKLLEEKRQALISHVVTKGLNPDVEMKESRVISVGRIPAHWDVAPFKRLGVLNPKKSELSSDQVDLECSFVPMEKLKTDSLSLDENRAAKDVYDGYTYFSDGDILFAKVTPCFENKNMCIAEGLTNGFGFGSSEINVFRVNNKADTTFLYYRIQESMFMQYAKSNMTGTGGLKRVPSDVFENYKVAVPPKSEQVEIALFLKEKFTLFKNISSETLKSIELLKEHRSSLISAAVTGKIDVREQ